MSIRDVARQLLTGRDGVTHDMGRWAGAASFIVGLGLEVYAVGWSKPFDFLAYGGGVAALAVGVGAFLKIKESTEPKPKDTP